MGSEMCIRDRNITSEEIGKEYKVITITKEGKTNKNKLIEEKEETISNVNELVKLRDNVNKGLTYEGKIITQKQNIDLSKVCSEELGSWEPIGYASTNMYYFKGTYNGDEKEITNIYINNNTINRQGGLFGYIGHGGEVKNIIISGTIINNVMSATGGIVGRNEGIIDNCVNNANVENNLMSVGGIAGSNFNTIKNCVNSGTVKGSSGEGAGGIVGNGGSIKEATIKEPIIESCTNTDKAIVEGNSYIGGICGYTYASKIKNCTNEGTVTASTSMVGGIVGESKTDISSCKNKGEITSNGCPANQATTQGTGGIAGRASSTISKCSNCLLYTSPNPRDPKTSRMPSSA